jgi:hypothetical protein
MPVGRLKLVTGDGWFRSRVVTTFGVADRTATWTGTGSWNGHAGYTFNAIAVDQARNGHDRHRSHESSQRAADRFSITISDSSGSVVYTTAGPVTRGNIVISTRSGDDDRDDHDGDGFRPFRVASPF